MKLCVHPVPIKGINELWERAAIGAVPGQLVLLSGFLFHGGLVVFAIVTLKGQRAAGRVGSPIAPP